MRLSTVYLNDRDYNPRIHILEAGVGVTEKTVYHARFSVQPLGLANPPISLWDNDHSNLRSLGIDPAIASSWESDFEFIEGGAVGPGEQNTEE